MKSEKRIFLALIILLLCAIMIYLCGCAALPSKVGVFSTVESQKAQDTDESSAFMEEALADISALNLMEEITPNNVTVIEDTDSYNAKTADFALRLFKASNKDGENTLISPLSVLYALSMTANGADGRTREQIEATLGFGIEQLNLYLYSYMNTLPQGEKYKLSLANSIWFTDDESFCVSQNFLQTNADYYGADVFKAPFDEQTLKDINSWVNQKTDGMITDALDKIPPEAVMYLINALVFEAEWADAYNEYNVYDGKFTKEDGTKIDVKLMQGEESRYIEDENSTGFVKYYNGNKYAFVALLPEEGVTVSEYISSLDGEKVSKLLSCARSDTVYTIMPKFKTEYDVEMARILEELGITDAFNSEEADFSRLGSSSLGNIYISRVIHKTFIEVGELGTRAGASTVIECKPECAPMDPKYVYLDRPFVYMIIDCENNIPFFIGTFMG